MKKLNKMLSCLLLLCMILALPLGAAASEDIGFDEDQDCTLEILIENESDQDLPVADADVTLYKVADVKVNKDTVSYPCTSDFTGYAKALDNVDNKIAEELFEYAVQHRVSGETKYTDEEGRTEFTGLKPGVYLVSEIKGVTDQYVKFKPFLAVLPYDEEGNWIYRVLAKPKFDLAGDQAKTELRVNKVWNDDGKKRPKSVTVQLLCDGAVKDTVELSEENGWKYVWKDMDKTLKWSVQEVNIPEGYTVTYRQDGFVFTVSNTRKLVQTGQLNWPVPVLAIAGILCIIAGLLMKRGKGRK